MEKKLGIWVGHYFLPLLSMSLHFMTQAEYLICPLLYDLSVFFLRCVLYSDVYSDIEEKYFPHKKYARHIRKIFPLTYKHP